ncbi:MAG: hypothetical protein DWQ36_17280 [Acidobacteria bacterium]|nr:MAG: hypothetical protein DWQ30_05375 [Acidobacteriota bacterium]REK04599.1 MAG: hypothetical protein DWQ36_17280 [Acidobacteriota bacterium]
MQLLDPTHELRPAARPRARRIAGLEGTTVGLLDISKPRGDVFLDRLQALLEQRGARVERFRKPTFTRNAPPDLRREIAERCHAVVEALAD